MNLAIITGGPTSGKTRTLINHWMRLSPDERRRSCFLTANRAAADQLAERIEEQTGETPPACWSFAFLPSEILRLSGWQTGRPMAERERGDLVSWLIRRAGGHSDSSGTLAKWSRYADAVAPDATAAIGLLQRHRVRPKDFTAFANQSGCPVLSALADVYHRYSDALRKSGTCDYDGRNLRALDAVSTTRPPGLPEYWFVDEGQELDALQVALIAACAKPAGSLAVAVDSLRRTQMYRGAVLDAVSAFSRLLGDPVEIIRLHGSPDSPLRKSLRAFGMPEDDAGDVKLRFLLAPNTETKDRRIAKLALASKGSFAVITRSNAETARVQASLRALGVPVGSSLSSSPAAQRFISDALLIFSKAEEETEEDHKRRVRAWARLSGSPPPADSSEWTTPPENLAGWLEEVAQYPSLAERIYRLEILAGWFDSVSETDLYSAMQAYGEAIRVIRGMEEAWRIAGNKVAMPAEDALTRARRILDAASFPEETESPEDENTPERLVEVLPAQHTTGRHWDTVVVTELQDAAFPQYAVPSPFIPPEDAEALREWLEKREGGKVALGRFERRPEITREEERRLFLTAVSRAPEVILAWHAVETDHPTAPSAFLHHLLPLDALAERPGTAGWRCVLNDYVKTAPEGQDGCDDCPVADCVCQIESSWKSPEMRRFVYTGKPFEESGHPVVLPADYKISASSLNTWLQCPRRFFLGRVAGLGDEENDALTQGTVLHKILALWHADRNRTLESLDKRMEQVFAEPPESARFSSEAAKAISFRLMRIALQQYFQRLDDPNFKGLWIEARLDDVAFADESKQSHTFAGKIDLARQEQDGLTVIDFKSGKPSSANELRKKLPFVDPETGECRFEVDDPDVQLALYACAAMQMGRKPTAVGHDYITISDPRKGKPVVLPIDEDTEPSESGESRLTTKDLEEFGRFFGSQAGNIKKTTLFTPEPRTGECTAYRDKCPFADVCDALAREAIEPCP